MIVTGHDGRGEHRHFIAARVKVDARDVKRAPNIEPVGGPDYALVSKCQHLATRYDIHPTFCRTANLAVTLPEGPGVLVRVAVGSVVIEKDASILYFRLEEQPRLGLNRHVHPQTVQQVKITAPGVADPYRTLETIPILAVNAHPTGQRLVESGNGKQPFWRIIAGR